MPDAFELEYATETEATISELEEIATLRAIASASEELRDALAGYSVDVESAYTAAFSDESSEESIENETGNATGEEADEGESSAAEAGEEDTASTADEQLEVTETSDDS